MPESLPKCLLFAGMPAAEVESCLTCAHTKTVQYQKDALIFQQGELPRALMLLHTGSVVVGQDDIAGNRRIVATFDQPGEL